MKICHFADTHIGGSTDGPTDPGSGLNGRVLDFLDSLDVMIDYCIDNDADIVLFAGDAFNKPSPSSVLLNEFSKRMYKLSQHCPVILLVGNHDRAYSMISGVSAVDVYEALNIPNIIVANKYEVLEIETKSGLLQVVTFPYPAKRDFKSSKAVHKKIEELGKLVNGNSPCVFLGHFGVTGARSGAIDYAVTGEDQIDLPWFNDGPWDYVALGHIHKHQVLNEGKVPPIVYAGSIDRVNFGEEFEDKGFVWLEITEDTINFDFISVSPRPMITLDYEFVSSDRHITSQIVKDISDEDLKNTIVRIRIKVPDKLSTTLQTARIYEALSECYFIHSVSISRVLDKLESRLGDGLLSSLPSLELVDRYFTNIAGIKGKEKSALLELAKDIMEESDE